MRVGIGRARLDRELSAALDPLPDDAVVKLRHRGRLGVDAASVLSAAALRARKPTMTVSVAVPRSRRSAGRSDSEVVEPE